VRFLEDVFDRTPLHIPAAGAAGEWRRALLPWGRLNELLNVSAQWTEDNVKLVAQGLPVDPDAYLVVPIAPGAARRADPARIEVLLALGASLVADGVENASPDLKRVTSMLSSQFLGTAGANVYCSFQGMQAFRTHCDLHDVFAVHCEGEKVWRIYEHRELDPVEHIAGPDAHKIIEGRRGRLLMEVRMQPGDLLYIPRGYYHDALASSAASLHVTFSVARHTGRVLFRLLEELAMEDAAFRAYLPDGRKEAGTNLDDRLAALAAKIEELVKTPLFRNALLNRQLALVQPFAEMALPARPSVTFFNRTQQPVRVERRPAGAMLVWSGGEAPLGLLEEAARWFLNQGSASAEQGH
jgi:lysine-specific demethylase/histidyl-hydroxylase NO66